MAIQNRRGKFPKFDPSRMVPGEWAVVLDEDPSARDGRSVYICFAAGSVKRMATYEDMVENVSNSIVDIRERLTAMVEATDAGIKASERSRGTAEAARAEAEKTRAEAEQGRDGAEKARASAEKARASAETGRVEADGLREQRQLKNDEDQRRNNEAAKALAPATTGDIDEILAGRPVEGSRVIDTAALAYLWPKIVEWGTTSFAPAKTV